MAVHIAHSPARRRCSTSLVHWHPPRSAADASSFRCPCGPPRPAPAFPARLATVVTRDLRPSRPGRRRAAKGADCRKLRPLPRKVFAPVAAAGPEKVGVVRAAAGALRGGGTRILRGSERGVPTCGRRRRSCYQQRSCCGLRACPECTQWLVMSRVVCGARAHKWAALLELDT